MSVFPAAYYAGMLYYLMFAISIFGYGSTVFYFSKRLCKELTIPKSMLVLVCGIYGFASLYLIGTIANFFIPISTYFSHIVMFAGVILFFLYGKSVTKLFNKKDLVIILFIFFSIMLCLFMWSRSGRGSDFSLYHAQTIKWLTTTKLPFGLGNLHGRLGFNVSWFTIMSIVEQVYIQSDLFIFIAFPIFAFFYMTTICMVARSFTKRISNLFFLFSFVPFLRYTVEGVYPAELLVMLFTFINIFFIIRIWEDNSFADDSTLFLIISSIFVITIKASSIAVSVFVCLFVLGYYIVKKKLILQSSFVLRCIFLSILLLVPWIVKSVIMTGCLIYPVNILRIGALKWAMLEEMIIKEKNDVTGWARMPGADWARAVTEDIWLDQWLLRFFNSQRIFLALCAFAFFLLLYAAIKFKDRFPFHILSLSFIPLAGIVFWFITGPDVRFGIGALYSFPLLMISTSVCTILSFDAFRLSIKGEKMRVFYQNPFNRKCLWGGIITAFIAICIFSIQNFHIIAEKISVYNATYYGLSSIAEELGVTVVESRTEDNDIIYTPSAGAQTYDFPLPATPYFNPLLKIEYDHNGIPSMFWIEGAKNAKEE